MLEETEAKPKYTKLNANMYLIIYICNQIVLPTCYVLPSDLFRKEHRFFTNVSTGPN